MSFNQVRFDNKKVNVLLFNKNQSKWEDKTYQITAMYESGMYGSFTGYNVYFVNGKSKYFYTSDNVRFINFLKNTPIVNKDIIVDGKIIDAIKVDQFEYGYYRIYQSSTSFLTKTIRFEDNRYKKVYEYFQELADYAEKSTDDSSPLYFLAKNFKRIKPSESSCLFDYLKGKYSIIEKDLTIILPFSFNESQRQAIENALTSNISIIEGPPGTGKTQTILNLIANIVSNNMTCAVVSNNNTAIQNVYDKFGEQNLQFFIASLGNKGNIEAFFEQNDDKGFSSFLADEHKPLHRKAMTRIRQLGIVLKAIQETEVVLSKQKIELLELVKEQERMMEDNDIQDFKIKKDKPFSEYLKLKIRLEKAKRLNPLTRIALRIKFGTRFEKENNADILNEAETLYYTSKVKALNLSITKKQRYLDNNKADERKTELQELSDEVLKNVLYTHYKNIDHVEFNKDTFKQNYTAFIKRYPVILSTTHSLLNSFKTKNKSSDKKFLFNYVIIDEASQGDLLSSILAISCAENIIVVGDSKQLQQIEDESLIPFSKTLSKKHNIDSCFQYETSSILKSVKAAIPDVPTTLLREHYRCAPDIINFCNKMFYNGDLAIMTQNQGSHFQIVKTVPGNHARKNPYGTGQYNEREIDEVKRLLESNQEKDIGIITPFRYQADLIRNQFITEGIEADTVHKYQGRQKQEVILSFVVNSLEKSEISIENRLFDFITNSELLNVAISRGVKKVTIVVADKVYHSSNNVIKDLINYIEYLYGNEITQESTITSIFDNLYSEYTEQLMSMYQNRRQEHYTELLMHALISKLLKEHRNIGFSMHTRLSKIIKKQSGLTTEERSYVNHPWTHVDFLFYNKISKEQLFALEVDGIRHHEQNLTQTERDQIKNKAFELNHMPLYRFKTNESEEEYRLSNILKNYSH